MSLKNVQVVQSRKLLQIMASSTTLPIMIIMFFNVALFAFAYIPTLSYWTYKYYEFREHVAMRKRYWHLNMFEIGATLSKLCLAVITTLLLLFGLDFASPTFNGFDCLQQFASYSISYFQIWRFYILRYDIIFTSIALNDEWKTIINPHYLDNTVHINKNRSLNWYFANKTRFGNAKWFGLRVIAPCITVSTIIQSYFLISDSVAKHQSYGQIQRDQLFVVILDFIPIFVLIYLYAKTPFIDDTFFIRSELKRLFIWKLMENAAYTAFLVYHYFNDEYSISDSLTFGLLELAQFDVIILCEFAGGMVSTYWVNKRLAPLLINQHYVVSPKATLTVIGSLRQTLDSDTEMNEYHTDDLDGDDDMQSNLSVSSLHSKHHRENTHDIYPLLTLKSVNNVNRAETEQVGLMANANGDDNEGSTPSRSTVIELIKILQHSKGFELFVHHLLSEFSVECALSFVEMIQFQQYVYQYLQERSLNEDEEKTKMKRNEKKDKNKMSESCLFRRLRLPNEVPLSYLVYGKDVQSMEEVQFAEMEEAEMVSKCKSVAFEIAQRYVFQGSEFEINVRYSIRNRIVRKMASYEEWMNDDEVTLVALIHVFEDCCASMYQLMYGSYERFRSTRQYEKLHSFIML